MRFEQRARANAAREAHVAIARVATGYLERERLGAHAGNAVVVGAAALSRNARGAETERHLVSRDHSAFREDADRDAASAAAAGPAGGAFAA